MVKKQTMIEIQGGGATRKTGSCCDLDLCHFEDKDNSSPKPLKKTCLEEFYEKMKRHSGLDPESINADRNNLRRIDRTDQSSRKAAFTMAEVLITLGIIGIIAAMTLPTLIQRKQEKITVTRLKKAYSILSQTYDRMVYELGSEPRDWGMGGMYEEETHIILANKFLPYLNVIQNCIGKDRDFVAKHCIDNEKYANPKNYASVRLIDGTTLIFRNWAPTCNYNFGNEKHLQNVCGSLIVDINGPGSPNLNGNDIFVFYLTNY